MNNPQETTIEYLRKSGHKVRVMHQRIADKKTQNVSHRGGYTKIDIRSPEGIEVTGEAQCSLSDNWNRKLGNKIALNRALKKLSEEKS